MKKRRCNAPSFSTTPRNEEEAISESIPYDLIIGIFMRLPAKSITRFRCVSKLWDSTFDNPDFTEPFYTISSSRPKLLFSVLKDGKTFFFSSPMPQDSSALAVNIHMSFPFNRTFEICRPVRGLVCEEGSDKLSRVYDPIGKQFKLLCMIHSLAGGGSAYEPCEILTVEPGKKPSWREISCDITHCRDVLNRKAGHNAYDGICIDGVLYSLASVFAGYSRFHIIVCFDFTSEKFKCINQTLVNYKGKLALRQGYSVDGEYSGYQLWVLEDAKNQKWSSYIYSWSPRPPLKKIVVAKTRSSKKETLFFVGTSDTGEIVLSPKIISDSFYLLYCNLEKSTLTRVEIQGMEAFKDQIAHVFLDHVEDLRKISRIMAS
ncbi:PREDICTED: F-box protein At3g61340-like [Camelina sativa]|uniref:F-box protein At3g61340-like n=1 Tax=Camelina sativa TaxID=90675 RepID=A0ABM0ZCE3_CAMSA|nr:PREDICTED: F-box protein At3g61340-like [Camelina sativa]